MLRFIVIVALAQTVVAQDGGTMRGVEGEQVKIQLIELKPVHSLNADASRFPTVAAPKTYYLSDVATDWFTARKHCAASGLQIVQIKNEAKQRDVEFHFVDNGVHDDVWIGLNDLRAKGKWEWEDGTLMIYANWFPGHQNSASNSRNCVSIEAGVYKWYEFPCNVGTAGYIPMKFLCETPGY